MSKAFTRIVSGGQRFSASQKSGSYRKFTSRFFGSYLPASQLGRERLTVCPRNPRLEVRFSGLYLITDTSSGKVYVGSAYGHEGIWQRWSNYCKNGHGGNKELKALLQAKGKEYASYFQFSLLEVCDLDASEEVVLPREKHWMEVMCSREFGLN